MTSNFFLIKTALLILLWYNYIVCGENGVDADDATQNISKALESLLKQNTILSDTEISQSLMEAASDFGNILYDIFQNDAVNVSSEHKDALTNVFVQLDTQMNNAVKAKMANRKRKDNDDNIFESVHIPLKRLQEAFEDAIENLAQEDIEVFRKTCLREKPLELLNKMVMVRSIFTKDVTYADKYFKKFILFYPLCIALMSDTLQGSAAQIKDPKIQFSLVEGRVKKYYDLQKPGMNLKPYMV